MTQGNPAACGLASCAVSCEYSWPDARANASHEYLLPAVCRWIEPHHAAILDVGCGNGALTGALAATVPSTGHRFVGLDSSASGIEHADRTHSNVEFRRHDLSEPLPTDLRHSFDLVLAVEVIEHLFLPRVLFARAREALRPGGQLIITTPYHGYLKNVALAVSNRFDDHWNPLTDYGHIKFFSRRTLTAIAQEQGFHAYKWAAVGRIPALAKSLCVLLNLSPPGVGNDDTPQRGALRLRRDTVP